MIAIARLGFEALAVLDEVERALGSSVPGPLCTPSSLESLPYLVPLPVTPPPPTSEISRAARPTAWSACFVPANSSPWNLGHSRNSVARHAE